MRQQTRSRRELAAAYARHGACRLRAKPNLSQGTGDVHSANVVCAQRIRLAGPIHRKRATISFAPNFGYALAAKRAAASQTAKWDLSCVKAFGCGAEPINPGTMRAFIEKFAICGLRPEALVPCYGMAEATLAISFGPAQRDVFHRRDRSRSACKGAVGKAGRPRRGAG